MKGKSVVIYFLITVIVLLIVLFLAALVTENGDVNASSMYLVAFWYIPFAVALICGGMISLFTLLFKNKETAILPYLLPSVVFVIVVLCTGNYMIFWIMAGAATVINLLFYNSQKTRKIN